MNRIKKIFNYANILGTKFVKIFVGSLSTAKAKRAEYKRSVEFLSEMTNLAKSHGIIITGETHQKTLFDDIESCRKLLNDVKAANFKICFQPYNMYDTEQTLNEYEVLRENVIHVHYQGRKDKNLELLKYSDIDYDALTMKLIESGFSGHISIEFVKDCVVKKSEDFDLPLVLKNAQRDRDFILRIANKYGSQVLF